MLQWAQTQDIVEVHSFNILAFISVHFNSVAQLCLTFATLWTAAHQASLSSPTPGAYSNSCPLSRWCHSTISFSLIPCFSQSFPASRAFQISQFFTSGGQNIGVSASALPMNIQGWFPLGLNCLTFLLFKGLSRVFSITTIWKHQFFGTYPFWGFPDSSVGKESTCNVPGFDPWYGGESWTIKKAERQNRCFQIVMLEKTLESPLDSKKIKPVNPKVNQPWLFIGRNDAEAPIFWPPDVKNWLTGKDPDAGKDWRQEEKVATEDEMVR